MSKTNSPSKLYSSKITLTNCDKEPIHILGKIQNHGVLLAFDKQKKLLTWCSNNVTLLFNKTPEEILNKNINTIVSLEVIKFLTDSLEKKSVAYKETVINNRSVTIIAHKSDLDYIFDFEFNDLKQDVLKQQLQLTEIVSEINTISDLTERCDFVTSSIKNYLHYDRVMMYQFDASWNGKVISEKKENHLESWLGLQYPASDIPQQARKLFLKQGARIIQNVNSTPVDLVGFSPNNTNEPLDLSNSELRSVSPIHIEYLQNMKVGATLTIAIVHEGILWGLIACHHYSPKYVSYLQRLSCSFLAQMFATRTALDSSEGLIEKIKKNSKIRSTLINQINDEKDLLKGLTGKTYSINNLTASSGAAICIDEKITRIGKCPSKREILKLIKNIKATSSRDIYYTDHLMGSFKESETYKNTASGVLCVFISKSKNDALIWFKPEIITTVNWAGAPAEKNTEKALSPRKSFKKWSIEQLGKSETWQDDEISAVISLQKSIHDITLKKYDEVKKLNAKLKMAYEELETFSYSVSHDLRAPLRGIDGFANILKEDYYDSLDEFGKSSIGTIIASVNKMNSLIDDILEYSKLGQKPIKYSNFSIEDTIHEILPDLKRLYPNTKINIQENLPHILGDQAIVTIFLKNLLENAMKYSSKKKEPQINIGYQDNGTYYIRDNGIGFEMKHKDKIFGVFDRLVNTEYPGSGIGLAIAKRIINKHGGKIWAESKINNGSTFYFNFARN